MNRTIGRAWLGAAAAVLLLAGTGPAGAQQYPARPVTLVCPYAPATGIDIVARVLSDRLNAALGYKMVVRNQPGASGNIGADAVATAAPDGYTILIAGNNQILNQFVSKGVRDLPREFAPITITGTIPYVLGIPSALPAKSMAELVALARAKPGEINYSGIVGSVSHLLGVVLAAKANIDIRFISYKSTNDALTDVLSGRVPIWITTVPSALPYVKAGTVRVLGVAGDHRAAGLADVPTMNEAGYPDLSAFVELYVLAPLKTPPAIINKLNADLVAAMAAPEVREKLAGQGIDPVTTTPEQTATRMREQAIKWAEAVKLSGLKAE